MASVDYIVVHPDFWEYPGESDPRSQNMADRCRKFRFYSIASSGSSGYYTNADCEATYWVTCSIFIPILLYPAPCSLFFVFLSLIECKRRLGWLIVSTVVSTGTDGARYRHTTRVLETSRLDDKSVECQNAWFCFLILDCVRLEWQDISLLGYFQLRNWESEFITVIPCQKFML